MANALLMKVLAEGRKKDLLRWRVSEAQLAGIAQNYWMISPPDVLRREFQAGFPQSGLFVGIPYVCDPMLPDDQIILEEMAPVERVATIYQLAIPASYGNVKEAQELAIELAKV